MQKKKEYLGEGVPLVRNRSGEGEVWSLFQVPTEGFLPSALLFVIRGSDTQGCCEDHRKKGN